MIIGIVQARTSSTRLPRKVLMPIHDRSMILMMLDRISTIKWCDELWVATSMDSSDDELAAVVVNAGYKVFRGDLDNVLKRYYDLAKIRNADIIVRLTGDCPLHDPNVIGQVLKARQRTGNQYVTNKTYPDGLDVEVFTIKALTEAYERAVDDYDKEHVASYMARHFSWYDYPAPLLDFSNVKWSVDTLSDLVFVRQVFDAFPNTIHFGWEEIITWQLKREQP